MGRGPALWPGVCPSCWPLPAPPPAPCSGTPGGLRLSCWNPVPWAAWGPACKCTPNTHTPRRGTCMGHEHTPQPRHQHGSPKCQPWSRTLCPRELGAVWEGTEGPELPPRRGLSRKGTSPGDTAVAEQWLRGPLGQATGRHFLSLGSACPAGHTGLSGRSPHYFLGMLRAELLRALVPTIERGVGGGRALPASPPAGVLIVARA